MMTLVTLLGYMLRGLVTLSICALLVYGAVAFAANYPILAGVCVLLPLTVIVGASHG